MTTWTDEERDKFVSGVLSGLTHRLVPISGREPERDNYPKCLNPKLIEHAQSLRFHQLYLHQIAMIESLMAGHDTAIVTGTSSGKTLGFALPVMHACMEEPNAHALFIYPTKALAQDQLARIERLSPSKTIRAAVYDGDTPKNQRSLIRNEANIVLTNPDMLHVGILPANENWRKFFRSLRYVVIDEVHTLRGAFGSHAALVLRRLLRLCEWYGSRPVVACSSATLPNVREHLLALTGREFQIIDHDTSLKSPKLLTLVAPSDSLEDRPMTPNRQAAEIMAQYTFNNFRSLVFCKSRVSAELVTAAAKKILAGLDRDPDIIDCYRGGYTASERRAIEKNMFSGNLVGIVSTNALELGIDIGNLDCVIMNGFPGSINSFWQMAGRAGRGYDRSEVYYIAHEDPMEYHFLEDPTILLKSPERAAITLDNPDILSAQLRCAAFERPIAPEELPGLSPTAQKVADELVDQGEFALSAGRYFIATYQSPAARVSLRGAGGHPVYLMLNGQPFGEMEEWRALRYAFPGAIYLHRDTSYIIGKIDWMNHMVPILLPDFEVTYYTEPIYQTLSEERIRLETKRLECGSISFSSIHITSRTTGYRKIALQGGEQNQEFEVDMPTHEYQTMAAVVDFDPDVLAIFDEASPAIVHAVEHALASTASIIAGCDSRDLGSMWFVVEPSTMSSRVVVYDSVPGGLGWSKHLFDAWEDWLQLSIDLLEACPCEEGCAKCLYRSSCESANRALDKQGGLELLKKLQATAIT